MRFQEFTEIIVLLAAGLTALAIISGKVKKMVANTYNGIVRFFRMGKMLDDIYQEFRPNGGGSLKDAMNRIEKNGCETNKKLEEFRESTNEGFDKVHKSLEKVKGRVSDLEEEK